MTTGGPSGIGSGPLGPGSLPDDVPTPQQTLSDDVVAAQKAQEKQRKLDQSQSATGRQAAVDDQRSDPHRRVQQASAYERSQDAASRKRYAEPRYGKDRSDGLLEQQPQRPPGAAERIAFQKQRLLDLMDELAALSHAKTAASSAPQGPDLEKPQAGPLRDRVAPHLEIEASLGRMTLELRAILRFLLSGGLGFRLSQDPHETFRRLWQRLRRWPKHIPPGVCPESAEDYDAFIAWVFAAPPPPDDAAQ